MNKKEEHGRKIKKTELPEKIQNTFKTLAVLKKRYPKAFNKNIQPLKLGILNDLNNSLNGKISKTQIRNALKYYTNSILYQQAVISNKFRIDLKGNKHSLITDEHKLFAQKQLEKLLNKKIKS